MQSRIWKLSGVFNNRVIYLLYVSDLAEIMLWFINLLFTLETYFNIIYISCSVKITLETYFNIIYISCSVKN